MKLYHFARGSVQHLIKHEAVSPGLESFVPEFYRDRLREIESIGLLIEKPDLETIRQISHRWKGYSAPYGFQTLAELGAELENCCSRGEVQRSKTLIKRISVYLELKGQILSLS